MLQFCHDFEVKKEFLVKFVLTCRLVVCISKSIHRSNWCNRNHFLRLILFVIEVDVPGNNDQKEVNPQDYEKEGFILSSLLQIPKSIL